MLREHQRLFSGALFAADLLAIGTATLVVLRWETRQPLPPCRSAMNRQGDR